MPAAHAESLNKQPQPQRSKRPTAAECIGRLFAPDGLCVAPGAGAAAAAGGGGLFACCMTDEEEPAAAAAGGGFFFVQIGASVGDSPHDPIFGLVARHKWSGLLVEPLSHAFAKLRANYAHAGCAAGQLLVEQCAISDCAGQRTMHFVDEEADDFKQLPPELQEAAKGTASFDKDHPRKVVKVQGGVVTMKQEVCRVEPLAAVLARRAVAPAAVKLLVVDTEGHDAVILSSIDFSAANGFRPAAILFEHRHTDGTWSFPVRAGAQFKQVNGHLHAAGYTTARLDLMDTLAVLDASLLPKLSLTATGGPAAS